MSIQSAYINEFIKVAEDNNIDPIELVQIKSRIDPRTLERFAREDAALRYTKGKDVTKHSIIGGAVGATIGALAGALSGKKIKGSSVNTALATSALGGVAGAGIGSISGAITELINKIKEKRARREHVEQFVNNMYLPIEN